MNKGRILVVEDDVDISNMLRIYFTGQGYEVNLTGRGEDALALTREKLPSLIVLDIILPDMDGYAVCKALRTATRTSHIPIIFLTQKDERSDRIAGLELGADDYVTKPFDIEELRLRVQNALSRAERESLTDPRTGLPAGRLIEDQLRHILRSASWALLDLRINHFDTFKEAYGFVAGDDVLRFTAMMINQILDQSGQENDFVGHVGGDNFLIITSADRAGQVEEQVRQRFAEGVQSHYSSIDRERGHILVPSQDGQGQQAALMDLSIGLVTSEDGDFADIREITEKAAKARRRDPASSAP
ncbi:MAG: response regulator [Anaerolineales bacterium]|jgi:diguanylate cyclase (GGDEF)-like protein